MKDKRPISFILLFSGFVLLIIFIMQFVELAFGGDIGVIFPKGMIGVKERNLLLIIQALMLIVVIPVYILTFIFSWRYRAENKNATYAPDWVDNRLAETVWWGIPLILVIIIGALTWIKTYQLDPMKPIASDKKPMTIQVVALQWNWLFLYPEQDIASVNFVQFPENVPIRFEITADAPMNSFWIPHLGGQIYAMPKMRTELNLIANEQGEFRGSSANISGKGFANMFFTAKASSEEEFANWVKETKETKSLNFKSYEELAKPNEEHLVEKFKLEDKDLFNKVLMKYMHPQKPEVNAHE